MQQPGQMPRVTSMCLDPIPTRADQLRRRGRPGEIVDEDAVTYFTPSADDLSWLAGFNRAENRLGVAVQLSTLPWLGWVPDDPAGCPAAALDRLANALAIDPTTAAELLAA